MAESTVCRYGSECFREGCIFQHPTGKKGSHKGPTVVHQVPMFYPPQTYFPGQPMYYPQPHYYPYGAYPPMEAVYDPYNNYENYENYEEYYPEYQPLDSSGEYILDKEITPEMEEDFFEFQEDQKQDPDTWIPERRDCKCCQGYVYKCNDKTCMSLGVCVCHYEHDDNNPQNNTSTSIQVSAADKDNTSTIVNATSDTKKYVPPHLRNVDQSENNEEYFDSKANCSCCKGFIYACKTPTCVMMGICGCQYCHSEPTITDLQRLLSYTNAVDDGSYQEILRISLTKENYTSVVTQIIDAIAVYPARHAVFSVLISKLRQVNRNLFEEQAELNNLKKTIMEKLGGNAQQFISESNSNEQNTEIYEAYFLSFDPLVDAKLISPATLNKLVPKIAAETANIPLLSFVVKTFKKHLTDATKVSLKTQFKEKAEFKDILASLS